MQPEPTMNNEAENQTLVSGTRGREFESHRPDHLSDPVNTGENEDSSRGQDDGGYQLRTDSAHDPVIPVLPALLAVAGQRRIQSFRTYSAAKMMVDLKGDRQAISFVLLGMQVHAESYFK